MRDNKSEYIIYLIASTPKGERIRVVYTRENELSEVIGHIKEFRKRIRSC